VPGRRELLIVGVRQCLYALLFTTPLFGLLAPPYAVILCAAALGFLTWTAPSGTAPKFNLADAGVMLLAITTWLLDRASIYRPLSDESLCIVLVATTTYFGVRHARRSDLELARWSLMVGSAFVCLMALLTFFHKLMLLHSVGFTEAELFKKQLSLFWGNPNLGNPFGTFLAFVPLLLWVYGDTCQPKPSILFRALGMGASLLLFAVLIATFSRAIYLGCFVFAVTLVSLLFWQRDPRIRDLRTVWLFADGLLLAILLLSSIHLLGPVIHVWELNASTSQQRSTSGRLRAYVTAVDLCRARPLSGYGPGTFTLAASLLGGPGVTSVDRRMPSAQAYNGFLQEAVEEGGVGALLLVSIVFLAMRTAFASLKNADDVWQKRLSAVALAGLMSIVTYNLFWSSMFSSQSAATAFYLLLGLATNRWF
jgi:hypothetical protein